MGAAAVINAGVVIPTLARPNRWRPLGLQILELAGRPCGTNINELITACGIDPALAADRLHAAASRRVLCTVKTGSVPGIGEVVQQYFTNTTHRDAWASIPVASRPNLGVRRRPGSVEAPKPARQQATPVPPPQRRQYVPSTQCDTRFQLTEEQRKQLRGPFSSVPIGYDPSTGRPWR